LSHFGTPLHLGILGSNGTNSKAKHGIMYYIRQRKSVILSKLFRSNIKKCWTWRQKITVWDHNRDLLSQRASTILDDPQASKYVWELVSIGMKAGGDPMFDNVGKVHEMYP
jgi:glucosylceramidase